MERLCQEGASATFTGVSADGHKTVEELAKHGWQVEFIQGDMQDEAFCDQVVERALRRWGKIDLLVNNAFSFIAQGVGATREQWERMFRVGPFAYARMVAQCVEPMKAQGGGAVVNMSSISAHIAQTDRWTYNAAKGAVNQLTRCQALDLAPYNIRVNTLSPGWIWTREVDKAAGGDREKWGPVWGKYHVLRRLGTVEECAGACAFLLSDDASFVTGTELMVDGGYNAMGPEGLGETSTFAGSA
jgi:NAD(P)-dependent dehydrogenase (short-subunit alcohol dehydrogenase family)